VDAKSVTKHVWTEYDELRTEYDELRVGVVLAGVFY
jgi:hypothetical protein